MDYLAPIGDELLEEDRCQNRGAPDGQRCQLLIDHDPPHMASIRGIVRGWTDDGAAELPQGAVPLGADLPTRRGVGRTSQTPIVPPRHEVIHTPAQ